MRAPREAPTRLRAIFHDNALMSGYMMGEYLMGSPEPFFQAVENPPPGAGTSGAYQAEITSVEVSGPVASITLKEAGFMGVNFTDYFHLAKVNNEWKIISKTFNPGNALITATEGTENTEEKRMAIKTMQVAL